MSNFIKRKRRIGNATFYNDLTSPVYIFGIKAAGTMHLSKRIHSIFIDRVVEHGNPPARMDFGDESAALVYLKKATKLKAITWRAKLLRYI